jgi:hypothetical protein
VGKDLNIDSSGVHRSNPFLAEIVDTGWYAFRWVTHVSTHLLPLGIHLLNGISFVGLRNSMCFVMLFEGRSSNRSSVKIAGVRIYLNVDQCRALSLKCSLQCLVDIARPRDLDTDRSKCASDVRVRNPREADTRRFSGPQEFGERYHRTVAMVVQDNHDHRKLLLYGGPKGLNGVHGGALR